MKVRSTLEQAVDKGGGCLKGDYHIHTYYSDGVFSPEKIVDLALDAGLQVIALTDHDNVLSYNVAKEYKESKKFNEKIEKEKREKSRGFYKYLKKIEFVRIVHILF